MPSNHQGQDPWNGQRKQDGPPDLDQLLKDFFRKLAGKKHRNTSPSSSNAPDGKEMAKNFFMVVGAVFLGLCVLWVFSGIYTVGPAEQAVILRLGKYYQTEDSGLHWFPRFYEKKYVLDTQKVSSYQYDSDMLTKDENIVQVSLVVQYRIDNPKNYLFSVINPEESLHQATASALRQVVGNTTLNGILTSQRAAVRQKVEQLLKQILALYHTGLSVTDVVLQPTKPPEEVTAAFDDAIKAREDEQRYINKANAYKMSVVPLAQGQANRILQQAEAYKQQVVLKAEGDVARFSAILPIYHKMPAVTEERMYFDTIESVLEKNHKIFVNAAHAPLLYLPLNKWFKTTKLSANQSDLMDKDAQALSESSKQNTGAASNNLGVYSGQGVSYGN